MTTANILSQLGSPGVVTGFKNKLINGNFDIWQRGTTNTITNSGYTVADRWQYITDGTLGTGTVFTQQAFTVGQTAVPNNPTYYLQLVCTSVSTPNNYIRQRIENVSTLSGQLATGSFWVRTTSGTATVSAQFQQEFGSGGSPSAGVYGIGSASFTATTTWQQFSITTVIPSIAGKTLGTNNDSALNFGIYFPAGGASGTYQVAQCQVEAGGVVTNYDIRPLAVELPMCQRYYESSYPAGYAPGYNFGEQYPFGSSQPACLNFVASDDTVTSGTAYFKVKKRASPTTVIYSPNNGSTNYTWTYRYSGSGNVAVTVPISQPSLVTFTQSLSAVDRANESYFLFVADAEL